VSAENPAGDSKQADTPGFVRLIGCKDCPGASGFADPYVFQEGSEWFITSTYNARQPMYMFSTADFKSLERYTLKIDLNENYLRSFFRNSLLVARDIWGFVPYKDDDGGWHAYASIHIGG